MTYLLDSLEESTDTVLIATIGPSLSDFDETLNTLRFASRAIKIETKSKMNKNRLKWSKRRIAKFKQVPISQKISYKIPQIINAHKGNF